jgi:hypothetical protein
MPVGLPHSCLVRRSQIITRFFLAKSRVDCFFCLLIQDTIWSNSGVLILVLVLVPCVKKHTRSLKYLGTQGARFELGTISV